MKDAAVYIIHGYLASPSHHWFPWLKRQLAAEGAQVFVPPMPDPEHPDPAEWIEFLDANVHTHDERTFFVAHSLGCIALLRHLERVSADTRIGGLVLVSGFSEPLPGLPLLDAFTLDGYDVEHITRIAPRRTVLAALDDSIVPYAHSERLSRELRAKLVTLPTGGHFLESDGFTELPVALNELESMIADRRRTH
jgi:Predicted esterase of the alpha/beta hydrolase fold